MTILAGSAQIVATMKVACSRDTPFSLAKPAKPTCAVIRMKAGMLKIIAMPDRNHENRVFTVSSAGVCDEGNSESPMIQPIARSCHASKKKAARRRPFRYFLRGTLGTDALPRDGGVGSSAMEGPAVTFSSIGFFGAGFFFATGFFSTAISCFGFTATSSAI